MTDRILAYPHTKTQHKPLMVRWHARAAATVIAMVSLLLSSCGYLDESVTLPDGTVAYRPLVRIRAFARDVSYQTTAKNTYVMPYCRVQFKDGTFCEGTNVVLTTERTKTIAAKSITPDTINASADLMGKVVDGASKAKP